MRPPIHVAPQVVLASKRGEPTPCTMYSRVPGRLSPSPVTTAWSTTVDARDFDPHTISRQPVLHPQFYCEIKWGHAWPCSCISILFELSNSWEHSISTGAVPDVCVWMLVTLQYLFFIALFTSDICTKLLGLLSNI